MDNTIQIEVVYALADKQKIVRLSVSPSTTVRQAALLSQLDKDFEGLDLATAKLGIFGKAVINPEEQVIEEGQRVEIYRPLLADPKEVRKRRAAEAAARRAAESNSK